MKVFEVISDDQTLKTDIKHNKGKAVAAIVAGSKRKSNGVSHIDNEIEPETTTVMQ